MSTPMMGVRSARVNVLHSVSGPTTREDFNEVRRTKERVLVGSSGNLERLRTRVVSEPSPTRSLNGESSGVELGLEL
jgi:hypothetical protein